LPNKWVVSSLLDGQLLLSHQRLADEKRHQLRKWQLPIRPFQDLLMHNEMVNGAPADSDFQERTPTLLARTRIGELDNNNWDTKHIDILQNKRRWQGERRGEGAPCPATVMLGSGPTAIMSKDPGRCG
jgi:hypothetical protein